MNDNDNVSEPGSNVQRLFEQARELSAAERAQLVTLVLESLDEPDLVVHEAWKREADRRADGMDDGSRPATPWSEARKKLGL